MTQVCEHFLVDAFLQEQPAPGAASLTLTSPDSVHDPFNGAIEICIVKHDERRLGTQRQREMFSGTSRLHTNLPSHLRRTREGNLLNITVPEEEFTGCGVSGDDIDNSRGQLNLLEQLGEEKCC
jgi:hypothetical protein